MLSRVHPIIAVLLLFAVIGFLTDLYAHPVSILLTAGLLLLLFFLANRYGRTGRFLPRHPAQKRMQHAKPFKTAAKKTGHTPRKEIPFRVIEGSKGKTKEKKETKAT
jgi:uncharacterized protein (DUF58 family)